MSVNLITGYAGTAHITSAGDGAVNAGMFGSGKYVLNIGEKFGYEVISNNLIRIKSGYAINQGRKIELAVNDYEEVEIDNGLQGVKRCDLIVMHYEKSLTTGIETATMEVIKGTSGDDYTDPAYTSGDIINGANEDDFLLYRVKINGLSVEAVEALFTVTDNILEVLDKNAEEISNVKKAVSEVQKVDNSQNTRLDSLEKKSTNLEADSKKVLKLKTITSGSITVSASGSYSGSLSAAEEGYVPVGVLSFNSGNTSLAFAKIETSTGGTVYFSLKNVTAKEASGTVKMIVLFVKSGYFSWS